MHARVTFLLFFGAVLPAAAALAAGEQPLVATVTNELALARPSETVVLDAREVVKALAIDDVRRVHVTDAASGKELLTQAIDLNGDGTFEQLLFQLDLAPRETRRLSLAAGERRAPKREDFKAYGRFVRERYDDFAWENELVAHRMYGKALETWQAEPLTSSTVDVWCKRTRRLVVNDWYMVDDYHRDTGEGADFYSAGRSRGCGGTGIWLGGKLWTSRNFVQSRVIASGPIRVVFDLVYEPWDVGGQQVAEVKRVTLDAGQRLNRFESEYKTSGTAARTYAAGLRKVKDAAVRVDKDAGLVRSWESLPNGSGRLGLGIILEDPASLLEVRDDELNHLVVAKAPAAYYAGSAWDRGGDIADVAAWDAYLNEWAQRLRSPLKVTLAP